MAEIIQVLPNSILLLFSIAIIIIVAGLAVGIFFIIKNIVNKGKLRLKIGNSEIGLNSSDENNNDKKTNIEQQSVTSNVKLNNHLNKNSFVSVISNIIGFSTDMAYEATTMRQRLYSDQIRNAKSKFSMVKTMIVGEYIKNLEDVNVDFIDLVLDSLLDNSILVKLEKAFQADRFAEKTKDQILELYKPFIESAFSNFRVNLIKFINNMDDSKNTLLVEKKMIECVDNQKDLIKKSIVECFEYAHTESVNYVKELKELNLKYSSHINNTLKSYISDLPELINSLPEVWNETMPPNSVVGGTNV